MGDLTDKGIPEKLYLQWRRTQLKNPIKDSTSYTDIHRERTANMYFVLGHLKVLSYLVIHLDAERQARP